MPWWRFGAPYPVVVDPDSGTQGNNCTGWCSAQKDDLPPARAEEANRENHRFALPPTPAQAEHHKRDDFRASALRGWQLLASTPRQRRRWPARTSRLTVRCLAALR